MAVVTKYAKSIKDPASSALAEPANAEGRVRAISTGAIAVASGDSIGSKLYLGKIPSNAIPLPGYTTLKHGAITSVNDLDIGIEKQDGTTVDVNLFADGLDVSSAGSKDPFAAIAVADVGKPVWQLAGLSVDPGVEYNIVATMNVAATAAASIGGTLLYAKK